MIITETTTSLWDKLYKAIVEIEQDVSKLDGVIMHPRDYQLNILPDRYRRLGYPLGKNNRGWKKWVKKEMEKINGRYESP